MFAHDHDPLQCRDLAHPNRRGWARMAPLVATLVSTSALASAIAHAYQSKPAGEAVASQVAKADERKPVVVKHGGPRPTTKGSGGFFTGSVGVDRMFRADEPSHTAVSNVTFDPGARTAWHSHPLGQTLIVTDGTGWVQGWGAPVQEIRQGDVVRIPPNQKHWHGATATTAMTHISVVEHLDGKNVEGMEKVSDEQYRK